MIESESVLKKTTMAYVTATFDLGLGSTVSNSLGIDTLRHFTVFRPFSLFVLRQKTISHLSPTLIDRDHRCREVGQRHIHSKSRFLPSHHR